MIQRAVIANFCCFTNDNPHTVIDKETAAYSRPRMDLDARQPARNVGRKPRQPLQPDIPQGMIHSMQQQGMHPGISRQHFEYISRSRIAVKYAGYVFTNADDTSP